MTKLGAWKMAGTVLVLCAATAIAAQAQRFTTLADFNLVNGDYPYQTTLVQGLDGDLYGTTANAGANGRGNVFKITPQGLLSVVYAFCPTGTNCTDGAVPYGGLTLTTDGNLYGSTISGGDLTCNAPQGCGTIFRINAQGALTTIHRFAGSPSDGDTPFSPLLQASDGNLYGTTYRGGAGFAGTVFVLKYGGIVTTLHSFCMDCDDAWGPQAGLVESLDGRLYGTTIGGGDSSCFPDYGCGTVFRITKSGQLTIIHSFDLADGAVPQTALVLALDGSLYGTTTLGGANCPSNNHSFCGTVFRISGRGKFTTVYSFCSQQDCADGAGPWGTLIQGNDGNLYGTTAFGGTSQACEGSACGTIFQIAGHGALTTLHNFDDTDGAYVYDGLQQHTSGILYGTTSIGGDLTCVPPTGCGSIFSLDTDLGPFVTFVHSVGRVGQTGGILGQGFTGTASVSLNGIPATFTVVSGTYIKATVPVGATTGYVTVTTPSGTLTSNVPFHVIP